VILADTSVWVEHFRRTDHRLEEALQGGEILIHPYVIGELACGNFRNRSETLELLGQLPAARIATHEEAMAMIDRRAVMGRGIGYIDIHLLAGTALTPDAWLWTLDRRLAAVASSLGLGIPEK
jgi:predicted nucleic acid-binding protein